MSPADHKRVRFQGRAMMAHHLVAVMQAGTTLESAESYCAGIAEGLRDFLTSYSSGRLAYETLQAAADGTAAALAPSAENGR